MTAAASGMPYLFPPRPWTGCSGARAGRRAATRAWSARNRGAPRGAGKAWHGQIKRPEIGEGADPAIHATMPAAMSLAVAKSTKSQNSDSPARPLKSQQTLVASCFSTVSRKSIKAFIQNARGRGRPPPQRASCLACAREACEGHSITQARKAPHAAPSARAWGFNLQPLTSGSSEGSRRSSGRG